jgi:hypothetical protein
MQLGFAGEINLPVYRFAQTVDRNVTLKRVDVEADLEGR